MAYESKKSTKQGVVGEEGDAPGFHTERHQNSNYKAIDPPEILLS